MLENNFLETLQFDDLFDIDEIQEIQDSFSEATGVASIITKPSGIPITKPSNFCRLCNNIIRGTEKGRKNCFLSDKTIGRQNKDGAIVQPCLSGGLFDAGASISVEGKHIANWLIGQVKNEDIDEEKMLRYADEIGADREIFKSALTEVTYMPLTQFKQIAHFLFLIANELSQVAYHNIQQKRLISILQDKEEELIKAKESAEESNRLKTAFLQNLSHEIRTPMNSIIGFTNILKKDNLASDKRNQYISFIQDSSKQLLSIVMDTLTVSSLETHQEKTNAEHLNINEIINEIYTLIKQYTDKKNIQLLKNTPLKDEDANIISDKEKIQTIFSKVISNSLKYTDTGHINLGYNVLNHDIEFFVEDTGSGIPYELHDVMFDYFRQKHLDIEKRESGTGLGLSIAKGYTELLGGEIRLKSAPGKGTTIFFKVPKQIQ